MDDEYTVSKKERDYAIELSNLPESKIEKIERVCAALEKRFDAEAAKESQQKFRILFQRTAKEWLPFIVYCLIFGPVAAASVWKIVEIQGWWQVGAWIGLIIVMLIPIFSAPFLYKIINKKSEEDNSNPDKNI
jgi:formate-dependent nitrite reductase membrane component NrfD